MAIPGALFQVGIILAVGTVLPIAVGIEPRAALVIGACLSISSTLVVIKSLLDRGELDALHGRVAIGWAIVQDLVTIAFIVALPPLAGGDVVGPAAPRPGQGRALPRARLPRRDPASCRGSCGRCRGRARASCSCWPSSRPRSSPRSSRARCSGCRWRSARSSPGSSSRSRTSRYQAAAEVIPFRDLFAVLFFVSVGMLVDPEALLAAAPLVALLVVIAVAGKGVRHRRPRAGVRDADALRAPPRRRDGPGRRVQLHHRRATRSRSS